jgi:arylsulfatase A-like enzyme
MKFQLLLLAGTLVLFGCEKLPEKPNIILIMADDLGWGDTGYNGSEIIKTPFLDQMAGDGLRFDRFYSASAVCSPTRASVLTGRNPYRTGVFNANTGILRPEEITVAEAVKKHGYVTGHFGKWHLGTLTHTEREGNRGRPGNLKEYNPPGLHGFDVGFSTEAKVPTWDMMRKPPNASRIFWDAIEENDPYEPYGTPYRDIEGNKITDNLDGDDSRVIMDRVLPFITSAKRDNRNFLAVVWFHTPHFPVVAGPEYRDMYDEYEGVVPNYAGCITAMDEQIGRLRDHLKELGLEENTMVWFCSDNGPENNSSGSTGGLRERKRSLYEGGIRVPGLLVWPERIKTPGVTSVPCVTSDYLPTILDILGEETGSWPHELDGTSLLPLLEYGKLEREKPIGFAIKDQLALIKDDLKLYSRENVYELYNIAEDRSESTDIIGEYPLEAALMIEELTAWFESCRKSFEGAEYGSESYNRLEQTWPGPEL